jgi:hypothetical protein
MRRIGLSKRDKGAVVFLEVKIDSECVGVDYLIVYEGLNEGGFGVLSYLWERQAN